VRVHCTTNTQCEARVICGLCTRLLGVHVHNVPVHSGLAFVCALHLRCLTHYGDALSLSWVCVAVRVR